MSRWAFQPRQAAILKYVYCRFHCSTGSAEPAVVCTLCWHLPQLLPHLSLRAAVAAGHAQSSYLHHQLAALAAAAGGGGTPQPCSYNLLNPSQPYGHLGERLFFSELRADRSTEEAAEAATAALLAASSGSMWASPPMACGNAVSWVRAECPPEEEHVVRAVSRGAARNGWAVAGAAGLREIATPSHLPLASCLLFFQQGQHPYGTSAAAEAAEAAAQGSGAVRLRTAAAWRHLADMVGRAGLSAAEVRAALRATDSASAVPARMLLLPLADSSGFPALGLYAASVMLLTAAATVSASCREELAAATTADAALAWAAAHAVWNARGRHLRGWPQQQQDMLIGLMSSIGSMELRQGTLLPVPESGWLQHGLFRVLPHGCRVLAIAPMAKRACLPLLNAAGLAAAVAAAGHTLVAGPLELPEVLAERSGIQLAVLAALGTPGTGSSSTSTSGGDPRPCAVPESLLQAMAACSSLPCMVLDVTGWAR
ncbi:hypothetical protein ABPG75_006551 [Micractinium tetrahymenae]